MAEIAHGISALLDTNTLARLCFTSSLSDIWRLLVWVDVCPLKDVSLKLSSGLIDLACHALPCRVTMPTGLGQGPGRQSALEAVSSGSVWQHANVCKWRGPAMTPAHRRNGPCPSQQRTQDGGYTAQHTHTHTQLYTQTQKHTEILQYPLVAAFTMSSLFLTHIQSKI